MFCEKKIEEHCNLIDEKVNSNKDFDMTLKNEWVSKNYLSTNALGLREKEK